MITLSGARPQPGKPLERVFLYILFYIHILLPKHFVRTDEILFFFSTSEHHVEPGRVQ